MRPAKQIVGFWLCKGLIKNNAIGVPLTAESQSHFTVTGLILLNLAETYIILREVEPSEL